jgi:hypothetical protein
MAFNGHAFQRHFGEDVKAVGVQEAAETLFACGGAMLIRRDIFLGAGGFDDDYFAYFEDVDLGWRLWLMGHKVIFVPHAVAYHHHFGTTRKFAESKHLFLCERNALFNIYKNYSGENLARILPAALMLLINKFFLYTGFDPTVLGSSTTRGCKPEPEKNADIMIFNKIMRRLNEFGLRETVNQALFSMAVRELAENEMYPVSLKGLAGLSAVVEFMRLWENMSKKRERVQNSRKRSDKEVFPLFHNPIHPIPDAPEFRPVFNMVVKQFRLHALFGQAEPK